MTDLPEGSPPPKPPVLVWVVFIFTIFCTVCGLLGYLIAFELLSDSEIGVAVQRKYLESQTYWDCGVMLISILANITGATLLINLRRRALYFYAGAFVIALLTTGYNIVARDWLSILDSLNGLGLFVEFFGWAISIASLWYVWHLFRKGVLR